MISRATYTAQILLGKKLLYLSHKVMGVIVSGLQKYSKKEQILPKLSNSIYPQLWLAHRRLAGILRYGWGRESRFCGILVGRFAPRVGCLTGGGGKRQDLPIRRSKWVEGSWRQGRPRSGWAWSAGIPDSTACPHRDYLAPHRIAKLMPT